MCHAQSGRRGCLVACVAFTRNEATRLLCNRTTMLSKRKKTALIKEYGKDASDTGSPEVQIAILSAEIEELSEHLKLHRKDVSSRRGLLAKVVRRKKLLAYLANEDLSRYHTLTDALGIKKMDLSGPKTSLKSDSQLSEVDNELTEKQKLQEAKRSKATKKKRRSSEDEAEADEDEDEGDEE